MRTGPYLTAMMMGSSTTILLGGLAYLLIDAQEHRKAQSFQSEPSDEQTSADFESRGEEEVWGKLDVIDRFNSYADWHGNKDGCASLEEQIYFVDYTAGYYVIQGMPKPHLQLDGPNAISEIPYYFKANAVTDYELGRGPRQKILEKIQTKREPGSSM